MDTKIRNYVGWAIVAALVVGAVASIIYVSAYSRSTRPYGYRSFTVSGEGKVVAVPDVAYFTFSVITEGGTNAASIQKTNTEKVNKALAYVKEQGVEEKDIKTEGYSVAPRYQYFECFPRTYYDASKACPPAEIAGYTVSQTISVKVRNFDKAGDIISGVTEFGANQTSGITFTIDDPTSLQNQAREEAVEKAREKAEGIARSAGFRLGRLLSIYEGGNYPVPYYDYAMAGKGGGEAMGTPQVSPTIEPGSQDIVVSVSVTYEMR